MPRIRALLTVLAVGPLSTWADYWWISYEAEPAHGYPEECGWQRIVHGGGAERYFEEGALVIDSPSTSVCDSYYQYMPGLPQGQDTFRAEWRLRVDDVIYEDPGIAVSFSAGGAVILIYAIDQIYSECECQYVAEFAPGVYHEYALTSSDMLTYALFIDGALAYVGELVVFPHSSWVQWGDLATGAGAASVSTWDYARFGVLPAPQPGDVNCDGTVDFRDINPFVQALTDGEAYQNMYSGCWPENADINSDGSVDYGDINPSIEVLTS